MNRFNNEPEWHKILNQIDPIGSDWYVMMFLHDAGILPYKDGNEWCILVGPDLQVGTAGFGQTLNDALIDFLKNIKKNYDAN